jgi:hypothetical protein
MKGNDEDNHEEHETHETARDTKSRKIEEQDVLLLLRKGPLVF